jgi:hypothetical protein
VNPAGYREPRGRIAGNDQQDIQGAGGGQLYHHRSQAHYNKQDSAAALVKLITDFET